MNMKIRKLEPLTRLGKTLRELRYDNRCTSLEVAEALGICSQAVSGWETGKTLPHESKLLEIAKFYGIEPDSLYNDYLYDKAARMIKNGKTKNTEYIRIKRSTFYELIKNTKD